MIGGAKMEAKLFAKIMSDKSLFDFRKMQYKYGKNEMSEFFSILKNTLYNQLSIKNFAGAPIVILPNATDVKISAYKKLFILQSITKEYGIKAMEDEIHATLTIENISSSRNSIRKILTGYAPKDEVENRILGMKKGLDFISDTSNKITEENLYKLYMLTVGDFLTGDNKLLPENYYRHDSVYVVGGKTEHQGIDYKKLPEYIKTLIDFINTDSDLNDLLKAAIIHYYIAYLHPYFDGNGRTARMLHLWYLVQKDFPTVMFIPFSSYINESRSSYYKAFAQIEDNDILYGLTDVTPFLIYITQYVYNKIGESKYKNNTIKQYQEALVNGGITEKEKALFEFVLSGYGNDEFSTKQLEKAFGDAAYATIRSFVLKFENIGIFSSQKYSNRVKYKIK